MTFDEVDDAATFEEAWTPEQEALAKAVSQSVKTYIETTEALASGKFKHLRNIIPAYLSSPGNVLMAVCNDGVVIRYETKGNKECRRVVIVISQSIVNAAALLSQNLVHIESPEAPQPQNENFGAELKFYVHSPSQKTSRDFSTTRIWFQAKNIPTQEGMQSVAKPYRLLSVRNQLELELHGVLIPEGADNAQEQPFVQVSRFAAVAVLQSRRFRF